MSGRPELTRRDFLRGRVQRRGAPHPHRSGGGRRHAAFPLLRPPGALAEPDFLKACTRCGACLEACPPKAIRPAAPRMREAAGTPVVEPRQSPCLLCEDFPCVAACEPGALRGDALAVLGTARVQPLDCLNRLGSPCSVCVERCPVPGAISLIGAVPQVDEALCTGCGQCQYVCPAPQNAILILPSLRRPTLDELATEEAHGG